MPNTTAAPQRMTIRAAREKLGMLGFTLQKCDDEFRLNVKGGSERTAYYSDSLVDIINTARLISANRDDAAIDAMTSTTSDQRARSTKSPSRLSVVGLALLTPVERKRLGASLTEAERRSLAIDIEALRMKRDHSKRTGISRAIIESMNDAIDMLCSVVYATRSIDLETLLDDAACEDES